MQKWTLLFWKRNLTLGTIQKYCTLFSPTDSGSFIVRLKVFFIEDHILKQEMSLKRQRPRNICIVIERLKYCDLSTGTLAVIYIYIHIWILTGIDPYIGYV